MIALLRRTRVRLALAYAGVFTVVALFAAGALWLALARAEYASIDETLATEGRALQATAVAGASGTGISLPDQTASGVSVGSLIFDSNGRLLGRSRDAPDPAALGDLVRRAAVSSAAIVETETISGAGHRVRADRVATSAGNWVVVVSRPVAETEQLLGTTLRVLLVGMAMLVVAATVVGYGLAGTALRPVREMAATARNFSEHALHERLSMDLPDDELGALAATFNAMLDRLEVSFESLRRFTADAAHDLRGPLTLIRTEAEVALSRPRESEEYRQSLAVVLAEAERLSRLADQLLLLARADAGALVPQVVEVDLDELTRETVERWGALAAKSGVRLVRRFPASGALRADPDLLRRLLDNLVDNALRYAPGGSEIVVAGSLVNQGWDISVSDAGPGVEPAVRPLLFERFTRADAARGRETGGAGLGLALCAAIAAAHRGSIRLDQAPGQGARFVVRLPAG